MPTPGVLHAAGVAGRGAVPAGSDRHAAALGRGCKSNDYQSDCRIRRAVGAGRHESRPLAWPRLFHLRPVQPLPPRRGSNLTPHTPLATAYVEHSEHSLNKSIFSVLSVARIVHE